LEIDEQSLRMRGLLGLKLKLTILIKKINLNLLFRVVSFFIYIV